MHLTKKVKQSLDDLCKECGDGFNKGYEGGESLTELNQFFRNVLVKAPVSTLDERSCLVDDVDDDTWLGYFKDHVVPTIVRFKLIT